VPALGSPGPSGIIEEQRPATQVSKARHAARPHVTFEFFQKDMTLKAHRTILAFMILAWAPLWAAAADLTGTWKATFDTQMGSMDYTYDFVQMGGALTGVAKNPMGQADIKNGKIEKDTVTFVEELAFNGMALTITYTGKIVSPNEIQFSRDVGGFATETATAKRAAK
jgi:hypothetical protein